MYRLNPPNHGFFKQAGFTLNELLVVLAISGVLVTITIPIAKDAMLKAQIAETQNNLRMVANAIEVYASDKGQYPLGSSEPPTQFVTNYDASEALKPLLGEFLPNSPELLKDPFTQSVAHYINESIALDDHDIPEVFGYGYYDYYHFMVPPKDPKRGYGLVSFGPDGEDSGLGLRPLQGIGSMMQDAAYHPSNGLHSQGDLGRFGGNLHFPQQIP